MLFLCICSIDAFRLSSQFTFWNLFIYGMDGGNSIPRCDRATESAMEFSKGIANPRTNKRTNELSRSYSFCILLLPYHTLHSFILYTMIISVYNAHVFSAASLFLEPSFGGEERKKIVKIEDSFCLGMCVHECLCLFWFFLFAAVVTVPFSAKTKCAHADTMWII